MPYQSEESYWLAGGTLAVPTATVPAMEFTREHSRLLDFAVFAARAFLANAERANGKSGDAADNEMLEELILTRTVDNFLCFLTELLALIYKTKPQMLKASEQERLDFVLAFQSMDELRSALAEKRVERLSYMGLGDLSEYVKNNMGFDLFRYQDALHEASLLVEMRNICVHSRGVVGSISARRFEYFDGMVGKRLDFSHDQITRSRKFLENAMIDIDLRATEKFSLPCFRVPEPPTDLIGQA